LLPNPNYWGGGPHVELAGVPLHQRADHRAGGAADRWVDWTDNCRRLAIGKLAHDKHLTLGQVPSVDYWYLAPNFKRAPFDDPKVRQAITRPGPPGIAEAAQPELAKQIQTAIRPATTGTATTHRSPATMARARELLTEGRAPRPAMG